MKSFAELDDLEELEGEDEGVPDFVLIALGLAPRARRMRKERDL
jgi:hypothetical protein